MWPHTLSGRLPVAALVGHYPTNKLIGRKLIPHQKNLSTTPTTMRSYRVLDPVSQAYPPVQGRSLTCYSPVRHSSTPASWGLSVRLACVKHAASVHPEPGSNSPTKNKLNKQKTAQIQKNKNVPKEQKRKEKSKQKNDGLNEKTTTTMSTKFLKRHIHQNETKTETPCTEPDDSPPATKPENHTQQAPQKPVKQTKSSTSTHYRVLTQHVPTLNEPLKGLP